MPYSVSSWFYEQTILKNPAQMVSKFTIGSSDYSDRIIKWPSIKTVWDKVRETKHNLALANEDQVMNFLRLDKTLMREDCVLSFGYTHPTSGDELIELFNGTINNVDYKGGVCNVSIADKFKQLSERVAGSSEIPKTYTGNILPSTIAWESITSLGGFSAIESTSNPDIDFQSFQDWAAVFSGDAVYMNANFKGVKVTDILRRISRQTLSAIYVQSNKLTFHRFGIIDTNIMSLDNPNIIDLSVSFTDDDTVNKQYVFADYDVTSNYFKTTVNDVDSSSVNSFGLKEDTTKDESLWYVGSGSAQNLAQRVVITKGKPYDSFKVKTSAVTLLQQIGETIQVTDPLLDVVESFRTLNKNFNMNTGAVDISGDRSQFLNGFTLDASTLGSTDILT